ncbi:hypothetical protein L7F22_022543 [Adiantum nelumboides]|nr:hypothetical protein [Adiantum nelumboides]
MLSPEPLPSVLTELLEESPSEKLLDAIIQEENPQNISKPESEPHPPFPLQSVSTIENLNKAEELEEEPIDLALEEKESASFNVALYRAQTIVDEPIEDVPITETSLTLVHLPYFHLNGKDYITLHSTQFLFNIREDYCLTIISKASQVTNDFVDIEGESKEEFLALDLETYNQKFLEGLDAFESCLKRVVEEEPVLKDEDFEARLVELGIDKFGRNIEERNKINFDLGKKINLEHEGQIEADELQEIELLDEDKFLGRAGGSRATSKYTGHALIHYLPKLDKDIFCAFLSQFSDHPELSMFAIKTFSRFISFLPLLNNVNRIAYQALGMIEDLPAAGSQASLIQHARFVPKAMKTATTAASSRTTRSTKKSSSDDEKTDTDKDQESNDSKKEETSQKGAEAPGPSEHEPSDQEDTSTPLDRKDAGAAKEAAKKLAQKMATEEARKAKLEKAKALQEERRRLEAEKRAQEEAAAAQGVQAKEKEIVDLSGTIEHLKMIEREKGVG